MRRYFATLFPCSLLLNMVQRVANQFLPPCAPLKYIMKIVIRTFFKFLRVVLGPFMLLKENLTRPTGITRDALVQASVDTQCQSLTLFQFKTCPFCIKTRQEISRLALNIQRVDAQYEGAGRQALLAGGGQTKVPCLRITDSAGSSQWLYDSSNIIAYLQQRFAKV